MSRHACVSTTLYLSWDAHSRAVSSRARGGFTPVRGRPDWLRRLEVVPCYMVSQGGELSSALALPNTPLLAVAPIPSKDLFPIPQWRVRDGRGLKYEKWWRAVQSLLNAFDITVERLGEQPPVNPSIATASIITRSKDEEEARAAEEQRSLEHAHALDVWQRYNTAVYWHVLPSLIVDGVHERSDLATRLIWVNHSIISILSRKVCHDLRAGRLRRDGRTSSTAWLDGPTHRAPRPQRSILTASTSSAAGAPRS